MVRLKNLVIDENGNIIADVYPEDAEIPGNIIVSKEKLIEFSLPKKYEWCKKHIYHAERFIRKNYDKIKMGEIKDYSIVWC